MTSVSWAVLEIVRRSAAARNVFLVSLACLVRQVEMLPEAAADANASSRALCWGLGDMTGGGSANSADTVELRGH